MVTQAERRAKDAKYQMDVEDIDDRRTNLGPGSNYGGYKYNRDRQKVYPEMPNYPQPLY